MPVLDCIVFLDNAGTSADRLMGLLLTAFARKGFWKLVWHSLKSQKVMQAVLFGIFFAQPIHLLLNYALKFVWLQD